MRTTSHLAAVTRRPGPVVRALRQAARLSQLELATRCGISQPLLANIEAGRRPGRAHLPALAEQLRASVDALEGRASALPALRAHRGLSLEALAAAADITPGRLERIEAGVSVADPETAVMLGRRLGVDPAAIAPMPEPAVEAAA